MKRLKAFTEEERQKFREEDKLERKEYITNILKDCNIENLELLNELIDNCELNRNFHSHDYGVLENKSDLLELYGFAVDFRGSNYKYIQTTSHDDTFGLYTDGKYVVDAIASTAGGVTIGYLSEEAKKIINKGEPLDIFNVDVFQ